MCSHSRVRVPLRAFFFSCFTESMTKADSRVVDSGSKFAEMYSFVLTLIIRVLFLCSRFPIQCSKQFRDCLLVAEYCLKELSDSVFMFVFLILRVPLLCRLQESLILFLKPTLLFVHGIPLLL